MKIARLVLGLLLAVGCKGEPAEPDPQTAEQLPSADASAAAPVDTTKSEEAAEVRSAKEFALERLDRRIRVRKQNVKERAGWVTADQLATALLKRARLTGELEDFTQAGEALELAFDRAKPGQGPFLTRAYYNASIGRTDLVLADLKIEEARAIKRTPSDVSLLLGLFGDGAMRSGELRHARVFYQRGIDARATLESLARISYFDARSGRTDAAKTGYEQALELAAEDPGRHAWILVQRGTLDLLLDDPKAALERFSKAQELFSGWYLAEEYVARATLASGETEKACVMFELLAQTAGHGRYRAAAARCRADLGDTAARDKWRAEAEIAFERDLKILPGLVAPDAIDFYLDTSPKLALKLAKEAISRGSGPRASMQLAQALLANGRSAKARAALERIRKEGWSEPEFLATLALAHEGSKNGELYLSSANEDRVAALRARLAAR